MLRSVIEASKTVEIFRVADQLKRGSLVTKNLATGVASKANGEGVQLYVVDYDAQPTGHLADVEISAYDDLMDVIPANSLAILTTYAKGGNFATDQVSGTFVKGDYAVSGTGANAGLFVKATAGKVSKFRFVGDYLDGDKVLKQFEVIEPHTVA